MRYFQALENRDYRLFFAGMSISTIGSWTQTTGLAWLVLSKTGSPLSLGTVTALQFLPVTLFSLFAGALADRLPRRKLLLGLQMFAMAQAVTVGTLVVTGHVKMWNLYALALCQGIVKAFDVPARQSFIATVVGRERMGSAIALNSSIFNGGKVIGPAIGGLAIAWFGTATTFFINAVSYIAVMSAYLMMRPPEGKGDGKKRSKDGVVGQIREGLRYASRTPRLAFMLMLLGFMSLFGFNFTVMLPSLARLVLEVGPERFGLLSSSMGVGSIVSTLLLANARSPKGQIASAFLFVVMLALCAVVRSYWASALVFGFLGFMASWFTTTTNTLVQLEAPDAMRGRIMSIYNLLFQGMSPIGFSLTGLLAERLGVRMAVSLQAGLCGLGIVTALCYRALRKVQNA